MYYRTDDFRMHLALGIAFLCGAYNEGISLIKEATLARTLSVGLASIASLGTVIVHAQSAVINKLEASIINEKISFELIPFILIAGGLTLHLLFYKLLLDKGLPLTWEDPLLRSYLGFCVLTVFTSNLYLKFLK